MFDWFQNTSPEKKLFKVLLSVNPSIKFVTYYIHTSADGTMDNVKIVALKAKFWYYEDVN